MANARKLLQEALSLPEDERIELASRILASLDGGSTDDDWESAWLAELDRRAQAARAHGESGDDWSEVRARVLKRLGGA